MLPEVVHYSFGGKYLTVDYNSLIPLLIEAIRELNEKTNSTDGDIFDMISALSSSLEVTLKTKDIALESLLKEKEESLESKLDDMKQAIKDEMNLLKDEMEKGLKEKEEALEIRFSEMEKKLVKM